MALPLPVRDAAAFMHRRLGFCIWLCAAAAQAQPRTLDVQGLDLAPALRRAAAHVGVGLSYDPRLLAPSPTVCRTTATTPDEVFACVLAGTGLRAVALGPRLYTLVRVADVAPAPGVLRGTVRDARSGLALADASVWIERTDGEGRHATSTNALGAFGQDRLPPGRYAVTASFVGYRSVRVAAEVEAGRVTSVALALPLRPIVVMPVVVDGVQNRRQGRDLETPVPGTGADDVASRLMDVTGVHPGNTVADVHVQGGDSGDHFVVLDGAPVFTPPVIGGLIGAFSPFAIGRLTVQKAGFDAQSGSNTVGVIEAAHLLPDDERPRATVQADLMALHGRATLGGTDSAGVGLRAMVAGRTGLGGLIPPPGLASQLRDWNRTDPFLSAVTALRSMESADPVRDYLGDVSSGADPAWHFSDVHLATAATRPDGVRYGGSAYVGIRRLDAATRLGAAPMLLRDRYTWKTSMVQARRSAFVGATTLLDAQVYFSQYRLLHTFALPDTVLDVVRLGQADDGNVFQETALTLSLLSTPSRRLRIDAGIAPAFTATRLSFVNARQQSVAHRSTRVRLPAFASARGRLGPLLELDVGVRVTAFADDLTPYFEPRASLRVDVARTRVGGFAARVGAGFYRQFVEQLAVSSISPSSLVSSTRVWTGIDRSVAPPLADHIGGDLVWTPGAGVEVRAEGYFKRQFRLHQVDFGADLPEAADVTQRDVISYARGYASGLVATLAQTADRSAWRLRYEYGLVERQSAFYGANFFPVAWNEPHRLEATLTARPSPRWHLLARLTGVWGRAWGYRRPYYDFVGAYGQLVGPTSPALRDFIERTVQAYDLRDPMRATLPPWQQFDVSASYAVPVGAARLTLRADVLNVTNQRNVQEYRFIGDPAFYAQTGLLRRDARYGLPITPVVAAQVAW